ncbi:ABC transporter ATP-binding protein [Parasphingorhabdus cellanae]|uniref:ATP-binding cassette domain-containing protein n=1 Tax=Parasphingorhabdus cellanae TaxID=2806553 RepID=A0ABX7T7U4_9SPHN|nr:ATP-binding cassette domain-containing protein [Parasphingorhabdus cellanae]QTD57176.1 ATP-binding cassette domain-containing protein [Parasphingorhabdus cellanae]
MPAILEARQLSKSFGSNRALHSLDLTVGGGEILCLLGANGAGKTTTINLFLGFLSPTDGAALVSGHDAVRERHLTAPKLAYIPEQVALYPQLSGLENLDHFTRLSGRRLDQTELLAMLERTGLSQADAHRRAHAYSKGMRQKVGIAIAVARNAEALLLDEPMSGLDPAAANDFCTLLSSLKDQGKAILMATHDIFRARLVGTRIGIMKAGRLVELLDAKQVDAAELETLYLAHMAKEEPAVS